MLCPICQHQNDLLSHACANCNAPFTLQGKYRVTRLLGRGGYGAVYLAEQSALGNALCALKELAPDSKALPAQKQSAIEQFRLEANLLAQLSHPALPRVTDFFDEAGRLYLVMEYVEGDTLEERLARAGAPLPEAQVVAWTETLCDVLNYLHTCQPPIIHRDVKPANIKITPRGELKLIDFGIAKLFAVGLRTKDAARAVSPPYSPLEQYGTGTDARSDIYALGVTLYHLLTNHLPPEAPDRNHQTLVRLQQWNPNVSANMEAVVLKAIANDATQRFQTVAEIKRALRKPWRKETELLPQPAPRKRMPAIVVGVAMLVMLIIGAFVWQVNEANQRAQMSATAAARATMESQATGTAQAIAIGTATAQAQSAAAAQAVATEAARAQASATAQARDLATAQAQSAATAQALVAESARVQASATAQARAIATARAEEAARAQANAQATEQARRIPTAPIRNCRLDNPALGTVRFDNWVGLDLNVMFLRDGRVFFQAILTNDGRGCAYNLEPGTYSWRVRAPARLALGEAMGYVVINPGSDWVIPFCVAENKISNHCQ